MTHSESLKVCVSVSRRAVQHPAESVAAARLPERAAAGPGPSNTADVYRTEQRRRRAGDRQAPLLATVDTCTPRPRLHFAFISSAALFITLSILGGAVGVG